MHKMINSDKYEGKICGDNIFLLKSKQQTSFFFFK